MLQPHQSSFIPITGKIRNDLHLSNVPEKIAIGRRPIAFVIGNILSDGYYSTMQRHGSLTSC
jgi:hypothetical protein